MLGKQSRLGKILNAVVQGFRKSLYKGAAAGGASLVELHTVHGLVLDLDTFHILAADIQNAVHLGIKKGGGVVVGHSLYLTVVQQESCFHEGFAVAGGAGADDLHILRQLLVNLLQGANGSL